MIVETFIWEDEAATQAFAERLAHHWRVQPEDAGMLVFLHGNLGAGKTTLVRYLLRGLGVQGRIKSPTFAVVEPYTVPGIAIWHCDFYRFDDPREWEDSGLRELFASPGLKLVEWPENAGGLLPQPDWDLHLEPLGEDTRRVRIEAHSARGQHVLQIVELA
ncbi:MAG: tRNA (adenosine(37)-N6)-threonylcarbamoyltransferase complex ATPase subunit type 1 TsaE [Brachymonas sp.]|nr:tRNA (adenosine(37)-N6)-threonylcarbamoyltransferase complex ATPase subunit type 1 TsaE [Brachymonas sp.]